MLRQASLLYGKQPSQKVELELIVKDATIVVGEWVCRGDRLMCLSTENKSPLGPFFRAV